MIDQTASIEKFLTEAAARKPAPGGGSVAALVGALAASMGEMVANYSIDKKGLEQYQDSLKSALAEFHRARILLIGLMSEDQSAFEALSSARKPPPHKAALAAAVLACITVPQAMLAAAVSILEHCDKIVDQVNPHLLSDLAVCADLAMATGRCAMHNVRANLHEIADPGQRQKIQESSETMLSHALTLVQRVAPRIAKRMQKP
ncbi:MAG: cyclodeaminase/cyclohydrolase family protein [Tepidisphaeraceae bacterium]|jgi:formiminotetrahydrofolate cyclodeaminase